MILARFRDLDELKHAARRMRQSGCKVETYTPHEPDEAGPDAKASRVPLVILLAGVAGGAGFFLLQAYADIWAYKMNIGGRPDFSWPAYIPNAFEVGVLCAMLAGFVVFLLASGLPRLYHPVDRFYMFHEASRDGYFLLVETTDPARHRPLLESLEPLRVQEMA
ncbi:MAG TPA: DUF3341 domain-containing protein [Acetobacteraceae bacterium]|jgi:hypothetical protein|nr:DUF3341 domain-containing protein [Acetobacteraceae bacterium]